MKIKIIDTSVAIKWYLNEEHGRNEALEVLSSLESNPKLYCVPELFFNEMLAVLCRLIKDYKQVQNHLNLLINLGIERINNDTELISKAAELAIKYNISGYDAIYAACAVVMDGIWITADFKAHKKILDLKISELLGPLRPD